VLLQEPAQAQKLAVRGGELLPELVGSGGAVRSSRSLEVRTCTMLASAAGAADEAGPASSACLREHALVRTPGQPR
jgi:hypothetical protein